MYATMAIELYNLFGLKLAIDFDISHINKGSMISWFSAIYYYVMAAYLLLWV